MLFPHGVVLTVRHITETTDDLGDTTEVVTTEDWGPCAVAPRYSRESVDSNVAPVVVGKEIYGPAITIASTDEILIDGETWRVDGLPADYTGPGANPFTGWAPGVVVPVKRASNV